MSIFDKKLDEKTLRENKVEVICHLDNMIRLSEFYFYDEEYSQQIKRLKMLKKHIKNDDFNKIFKKEGDETCGT